MRVCRLTGGITGLTVTAALARGSPTRASPDYTVTKTITAGSGPWPPKQPKACFMQM
jgi:hypothetical protein